MIGGTVIEILIKAEDSMDESFVCSATSYFEYNHTLGKITRSDWLRDCEFIRNLRANSVIGGKLQISRGKSVNHSECKYKKELTINN